MNPSHRKPPWAHAWPLLLLLLAFSPLVLATNLTGTFKHPDGTPVNGKLIFLLSQPARLNDQSAQIVPMVKIFSVTNGLLEAGAFVYGNDTLAPSGTYYLVRMVDLNNNLLLEQKWTITGVNLDLGTLTPTTTGVVVPDPLLKNASTSQAVQGPVSFSAPLTAFSLTLNGNLNPGAPDSYNLGSSTIPWQELFASRWNSLFTVGSASGTALAPNTQPGVVQNAAGGSIAAGTYYFQITYFNRNGETTASPTRTVVVPAGATNRIYIAPGDYLWQSGCYGYITYASNDNVNFYPQTPSGVVGDFELTSANGAPTGKTGHYVVMGSTGARFNSLTFSGTAPPTTNTATIDSLQVALNTTMRQSDYGAAQGQLLVPVKFVGAAISAWTLTTPLIVPRYARIVGISHYGVAKSDQGQSRIYCTWTDGGKTACVMAWGGFSSLENLTIHNTTGNAVMLMAGMGYQGEADIAKNSGFYSADTTHTYYALKIMGVHYNVHYDNVYLRGDKGAIGVENAAGQNWTFENVRWDLGGPSAIKSVPSYTDPDDGVQNGAFPFGVSNILLNNILVEQGTGIIWDCVGLGVTFKSLQVADTTVAVGTDSLAKFGSDPIFGGVSGPLILWDSSFGNSGNARVAVNWVGTAGNIYLFGNSSTGFGSSTGSQQTIDFNNITGLAVYNYSSAQLSFDPAAAATTPHAINVHGNTSITSFGDRGGGANVVAWNEFIGRLVFSYKTGSTIDRANRLSLRNNGAAFELYKNDDTTYIFSASAADATGWLVRGHARVDATSGNAPQLFVGPSGSTAATGSVALINQGSIAARNGAGTADVTALKVQSDNTTEIGTTNGAGVRLGSTTSTPILQVLSATATLDFAAISAPNCAADLTITVTGAAVGDPVFLGVPNGSIAAATQFFAWVSATNTVAVRACAFSGTPDPASGIFRVAVVRF